MPPKRGTTKKAVDPATMAQAFQIWETSEENRLWKELLQKKRGFGLVTTTTDDLTDEWEPYLESLFHLVEIMRVPHKAKHYDMPCLRTCFFA
jgi:hypothetical protein